MYRKLNLVLLFVWTCFALVFHADGDTNTTLFSVFMMGVSALAVILSGKE